MSTIEQAEYDQRWASEGYSADELGYTPSFVRYMRAWAPADARGKGLSALEVGCGDGYFSSKLIELGFNTTGIDLSPVGVAASQKRNPAGRFQVHDLTQPLPFPDNSFDLVWCSEVLEHLFSPLYVLEGIRRVLKPGGRALLTVPHHGLVKNVLIALIGFDKHYDPTYPHIRFFTRNTLAGLVRRAGLTIDDVSTCGSGLGLRDWIVPTNILLAARKPG